jgi:hypothetical protein
LAISKRPLTATKTTDARMALGIGRKAPVSSSRTRATKRAVKTPCIGVQCLPQVAATMADRGRAALAVGNASPEAWAAAILAQREVEGVCGTLYWSPAGVLSHPLQLWSVDADGEMFPRASSWDD